MKLVAKKATAAFIKGAFAMMVAVLALSATSYGQVGTGTLTGRVTDQNGAVLPGSTVAATSTTTGQVRQTATDSEGIYSLPSLPPSSYKVAISKSGFQTQTTQLDIRIDQTVGQDFSLAVSSATATIEVEASGAAILETESHEIASTIDNVTSSNCHKPPRYIQQARDGSQCTELRDEQWRQRYRLLRYRRKQPQHR